MDFDDDSGSYVNIGDIMPEDAMNHLYETAMNEFEKAWVEEGRPLSELKISQQKVSEYLQVLKGPIYTGVGSLRAGSEYVDGWTDEEILDEIGKYLSFALEPQSALVAMYSIAPQTAYDKWVAGRTKREIDVARARAGIDFGYLFDPGEIDGVINTFEKKLGRMLGSYSMWRKITMAVLEEGIVKTAMQDLIMSIKQQRKSKGGDKQNKPVVGAMRFRRTLQGLATGLRNVMDLTGKITEAGRMAISERWFVRDISEIFTDMAGISNAVNQDLGNVGNTQHTGEFLSDLERYKQRLDELHGKLSSFHGKFQRAGHAHYLAILQAITSIIFQVRILFSLASDNASATGAIVNRGERRGSADAVNKAIAGVDKGDLASLQKSFWNFEIKKAGSMYGLDMYQYTSYGFNEKIKGRLRRMGLLTTDIISEFSEAEQTIFDSADERAIEAFGEYYDKHFSSFPV